RISTPRSVPRTKARPSEISISEAAASNIWLATACRRSRNVAAASLQAPPAITSERLPQRPPAIGTAVGVAGDDTDLCRRDADLVGNQLRQTRLQPLTVRRAADPGFKKARGVHHQFDPLKAGVYHHTPRLEGGSAGTGALREHGDAEAEPAPLGARRLLSRAKLGDVYDPRRSLHSLAIAAGVLHDPGHRGMREIRGQVTAPDFERIQPEPGGRAIHQPFHRCGDDGPGPAAMGRHRTGVA